MSWWLSCIMVGGLSVVVLVAGDCRWLVVHLVVVACAQSGPLVVFVHGNWFRVVCWLVLLLCCCLWLLV